jgi:hypothetical protein
MKNFESFDIEAIDDLFGMEQVYDAPLLVTWLQSSIEVEQHEQDALETLRRELLHRVDAWNEDELKMFFISPILTFAGYNRSQIYKTFSQRSLKATVNDIEIGGVVDFMLATGKLRPKKSFFFLHEYKRARGRTNDPLGQLLAEMLAARALNASNNALYGCFVEGRFWYFVILAEEFYSVSKAFDASDGAELVQIIATLRHINTIAGGILSHQ